MSEDRRGAYEPASFMCPDIEPDSYSSDDGSSDEGIKERENPDYQ